MNKHSGSNVDDFLAEEGILEEVSEGAQKRLLALQIEEDIVNTTNQRKRSSQHGVASMDAYRSTP